MRFTKYTFKAEAIWILLLSLAPLALGLIVFIVVGLFR